MKKALFGLSLLAGLSIFVYVVAQYGGVDGAVQTLAETGVWALLAFFANAMVLLLAPAASWLILMRGEGLHVSYWTLLKANFMGGAINIITPSLYLGGEPLKVLYVAKVIGQPKTRILATVVVAKFQEVGALLLLMLVAVAVAVWQIELTGRQEASLIGGMAFVFILFGLLVYAFARNMNLTAHLIGWIGRIGIAPKRMLRLRSDALEMELLIHEALTKRWKTFVASQIVVMVSALSIFMRAWIFFAFVGTLLGAGTLCGVYVITNVANSLPMPGGLGAFEGGMALFGTEVGLPESGLGAYLIVNRVVDLVLALMGVYLIAHLGLQAVAYKSEKEAAQ